MDNLIGSTKAVFTVSLSVAVSEIVQVDWSTRDGTAKSGIDYEATMGVVSFSPGETTKQFEVVVYGQEFLKQDDKNFFVSLSPPSNAVLSSSLLECIVSVDDGVSVLSIVVAQGKRGFKGDPGLSAYEQAVLMGQFEGTIEQWMDDIANASKAADRADASEQSASNSARKAESAATSASFLGNIFPTPEAGVDPVTGVSNGAYYNVRSPDDDSYLIEYQNLGGVPTATGKSFPSAEKVEKIKKLGGVDYWDGGPYPLNGEVRLSNGDVVRSTVSGNTQDPNVDMTGWVNYADEQHDINIITNKTGLLDNLAETVDATPFLQSLINAMPDGMTLDLLGKTFRVKKNTGFIADYPLGDQPCLVVKDKKNVRFTNGKLIIKEHGQGCFDVIRGSAIFENGLIIQGAGNFPPLDGNTGRGEKCVEGTGWFDLKLYNAGDPRNNSINTSSYSTGGFGGNFPQWGGGTASTWGVWNGGYIRNYGTAIYCLDSKVDVYNCELYGFNGGGVDAVGTADVTVERCNIHDNYSTGVFAKAYADGAEKLMPSLTTAYNFIHDIGHPGSQKTDLAIDPGYGIATSNANASTAGLIKFSAVGNKIYNCKRKGIEAHHATLWFVSENEVVNTSYGIYIGITRGKSIDSAIIRGNYVKDVQYTINDTGIGIGVFGLNTLSVKIGGAIITDNVVKEVGTPINPDLPVSIETVVGRSIAVGHLENATISNNLVINKRTLGSIAISTGVNTPIFVKSANVSGNRVQGYFSLGIFERQTDVDSDMTCAGNTVRLLSTKAFNASAQTGITTDFAVNFGNKATVPSDNPLNKAFVNTSAPTLGVLAGRMISIRVAFNGTATPVITGSLGTDFIESVTSDALGLSVVLKGVSGEVTLLGANFISSLAPSTGTVSLGYMYQRSLFGSAGGVIGFKPSGTVETHIAASALTSGTIEIKLLTM